MSTSNCFKPLSRVGFIALALSVVFFSGCIKEEIPPSALEILERALANVDPVQLAADIAIIEDTLDARGLSGEILTEPNGVRYKLDVTGSGPRPFLESSIRINYVGRFMDTGEIFDSNQNVSFLLARLIAGWQTSLPLVAEGSVVTLYIPSGLAYGPEDITDNSGNVVIPGDSILEFEIELLGVL